MKIITLNLHAFGKFQNKTIELKDGLNLIYGGNEAGKSTIQHFIEGMLFGFYKPYRKKRAFNDNYEKYKTRRGDKYYGSMIIEDDLGKRVRIERDFLKTRDGVRIFDDRTGEDISAGYPYDQVTKQYLPLGYTNINAVVYNNTVNINETRYPYGKKDPRGRVERAHLHKARARRLPDRTCRSEYHL